MNRRSALLVLLCAPLMPLVVRAKKRYVVTAAWTWPDMPLDGGYTHVAYRSAETNEWWHDVSSDPRSMQEILEDINAALHRTTQSVQVAWTPSEPFKPGDVFVEKR